MFALFWALAHPLLRHQISFCKIVWLLFDAKGQSCCGCKMIVIIHEYREITAINSKCNKALIEHIFAGVNQFRAETIKTITHNIVSACKLSALDALVVKLVSRAIYSQVSAYFTKFAPRTQPKCNQISRSNNSNLAAAGDSRKTCTRTETESESYKQKIK